MDIEQAILNHYHNGPVEAAGVANGLRFLSSRTLARATELRKTAVCAGCRQPIDVTVPMVVRDGSRTFHPSCAQRADAARPAVVAPNRTVIGTLSGGLPIFDPGGCCIGRGDGCSDHETFSVDVFDRSLAAGGQQLRLNHGGAIAGQYQRICVDAGALVFRFVVHDTALGRRILDGVRERRISALSFGFNRDEHYRSTYRGTTVHHQEATLSEISLLDLSQPAWFGSWIAVED